MIKTKHHEKTHSEKASEEEGEEVDQEAQVTRDLATLRRFEPSLRPRFAA
ncbi:MAG TPA: hypothetical protein VG710_07810 [Opitutus sp.]|nr:hypothetical protein [Opitutus sp.]